jgi:hypothetical protein
VDGPQPRDVLNGVVRGTELAVRHSWAHAAQLHIAVRVRDISFDLLQCTGGEKAGSRGNERDTAAIGQAGCDTDHVLLSNTDIDQAVGKGSLECIELAGTDRVVDNANDAVVFMRELGQGLNVGIAAVVARPVSY